MPNYTVLGAAGAVVIAIAASFIVLASVFYMRAATALSIYLKTERPEAWRSALSWPFRNLHPFFSDPGKLTEEGGVSNLVLGLQSLSISDPRYGRLLREARKWLIVSAGLWLVCIGAIGWLFQNSRWPF